MTSRGSLNFKLFVQCKLQYCHVTFDSVKIFLTEHLRTAADVHRFSGRKENRMFQGIFLHSAHGTSVQV